MAHPLKKLQERGFSPKGIIHAGANVGYEAIDYAKANLDAFVMVEPLSEPFTALEKRCSKIENGYAIRAVLGATSGEKVSFHETSNKGLSSSVLKPDKFLEFHPDKPVVAVHDMQTVTADDMISRLNLPSVTFDCLVADVQGYELEVLKGATELLAGIDFLYLECSLQPQYEASCSLNDLLDFLTPLGFAAVELELNDRLMGDVLLIRQSLLAKKRSHVRAVFAPKRLWKRGLSRITSAFSS